MYSSGNELRWNENRLPLCQVLMSWCLMSSDVMWHIRDKQARCNKSLRPRKPEGSLGRTAQDVHLDSHTAPKLSTAKCSCTRQLYMHSGMWVMEMRKLRELPHQDGLGRHCEHEWRIPKTVTRVGDHINSVCFKCMFLYCSTDCSYSFQTSYVGQQQKPDFQCKGHGGERDI